DAALPTTFCRPPRRHGRRPPSPPLHHLAHPRPARPQPCRLPPSRPPNAAAEQRPARLPAAAREELRGGRGGWRRRRRGSGAGGGLVLQVRRLPRPRRPAAAAQGALRGAGGIILAPEGINGSLCGTPEAVEKVLNFIQTDNRLKGLRVIQTPVTPEDEAIHHGHTSHSPVGPGEDAPFRWDHVRVKLKKEIVSFGDPGVMPTKRVGKYIKPKDWNSLISDPDTVVIDVRNMYEIRIGKFKRAVDPCTESFREFPSWVDNQFQLAESDSHQSSVNDNTVTEGAEDLNSSGPKELPRVAMYCTGGIRCEKASSFLLDKGFKEVYHLEGGILKYLEEIPEAESLWEGECFVFDKRVSVEHGLAQGTHKLCYGCKQPVSDEDMESPKWEYGVSCPYCFSRRSEEEKERARARHRQFKTWGVIGGPDKGRSPKRLEASDGVKEDKQPRNSV
uniref:Rhodanese domain-containing protein n=2 Tax=Aegilops tauschii subsp. strangulata TaxID=200361 RepID=A0A453N1C7_AEGTS